MDLIVQDRQAPRKAWRIWCASGKACEGWSTIWHRHRRHGLIPSSLYSYAMQILAGKHSIAEYWVCVTRISRESTPLFSNRRTSDESYLSPLKRYKRDWPAHRGIKNSRVLVSGPVLLLSSAAMLVSKMKGNGIWEITCTWSLIKTSISVQTVMSAYGGWYTVWPRSWKQDKSLWITIRKITSGRMMASDVALRQKPKV